jgi:uncharacterized OB-fold protein
MSNPENARSVPQQNTFVDAEPFWRGAREGKLVLQYCAESKRFQHYPRPLSLFTGTSKLEWKEVSGNGTVYAHTVLRTKGMGADTRLPLVLATIELDEGVRILGNVLQAVPGEVHIGARVRLAWDPMADGMQYPAFQLQSSES